MDLFSCNLSSFYNLYKNHNHNQNYDIFSIHFLNFLLICNSSLWKRKKNCLFNFCIIHTWRIKSRKKCTADLYIVNLFWNYLIFFYMTSVYPNKWPFRMHFNIFNDWIRRSVYIWPNYNIHWLLEDSLIIIPSFVLLSKLSVMNELWFQGL